MGTKRTVAVGIAGQRYTIRSDADETYLRTLAGFVDERLQQIRITTRTVPTQQLAVLTALNIADELFQQRKDLVQLKRQVRERFKAMLRDLDQHEKRIAAFERADAGQGDPGCGGHAADSGRTGRTVDAGHRADAIGADAIGAGN